MAKLGFHFFHHFPRELPFHRESLSVTGTLLPMESSLSLSLRTYSATASEPIFGKVISLYPLGNEVLIPFLSLSLAYYLDTNFKEKNFPFPVCKPIKRKETRILLKLKKDSSRPKKRRKEERNTAAVRLTVLR